MWIRSQRGKFFTDCNPNLTDEFVRSGYDLKVLER